MKKKILAALMLSAVVLGTNVCAEIERADFDSVSKTLSIKGVKTGTALPNGFTVRLFKPGTDELILIDYCESDGNYTLSYPIKSFESGNYRLCVTEADGKTDSRYILLADTAEIEAFMKALKEAEDSAAIKAVFQNYNWFLSGIGTIDELRTTYPEADFEELIAEMFVGQSFSDSDAVLNEAIGAAIVSAVNLAADTEEINELLEKYKTELGFDKSKVYGTLYLPKKTTEGINFVKKDFKSVSEFMETFNESVILDSINEINNYTDVMDVVNAAAEYLTEFNLSGYRSLNTNGQQYVQKQTASAKPYTKAADIAAVFNKAVADAPKKETGSAAGGGGGNGEGSSSSSSSSGNTSLVSVANNSEQVIFSDLNEAKWAENSILELYKKGIAAGVEKNIFNPNGAVTREQFAKMIVAAFGLYDENAVCEFSDIDKNSWCRAYVASAVKEEIVYGISDDIFGIGRNITREDMASIAYRAALRLNMITDGDTEKFADAVMKKSKMLFSEDIFNKAKKTM